MAASFEAAQVLLAVAATCTLSPPARNTHISCRKLGDFDRIAFWRVLER